MIRYLENESDTLVFENASIRREVTFRNGRPVRTVLIRPDSGYRWESAKEESVLVLPGFDWSLCETTYEDNIVTFSSNYTVRWVFEVSEHAPAIRTRIFVKGLPAAEADPGLPEELSPGEDRPAPEKAPECEITDRFYHEGRHLKLRCVTFFDRTDGCDSLVRTEDTAAYRAETGYGGSLFFASDPTVGESLILCKEAPVGAAHLNRTAADLFCTYNRLSVSGSGIDYDALPEDGFFAGYPVTCALCRTGAEEETVRLFYTDSCGGFSPFVMSNTWGDRSRDTAVCEDFLKAEILRAAQLGVDIVQIDDGWQTGHSANSGIYKDGVWSGGYYRSNPDFWVPDPKKFPHGLGVLCDMAYEHGIALGLWFSPDESDDYAAWERDAETLLGFYRQYGIRHFKVDGIVLNSKKAEKNLLRMCFRVLRESEGRINLQMDITAQKRLGYFYEKEIGTLFVENRYTDFANYYPHATLRNLWQLSRYIPAGRLQMELLNLRRNPQNYTGDPLAPDGYDADYVFGCVMAANPLVWAEMQHLCEADVKKLHDIIAVYKLYRDDFGEVIPVGECPDGYSLTGFLIRGRERKYYIGIRELSQETTVRVPVERILYTNDEELVTDGESVTFSGMRKFFFAIIG